MVEGRRHWFPMLMLTLALAGSPAGAGTVGAVALPVIDMHVHASQIRSASPIAVCPGHRPMSYIGVDPKYPVPEEQLVQCDRSLLSPPTSAALRDGTIAELRRHNVRRAVLAGTPTLVREWSAAAPGLFLLAAVPVDRSADALARLRQLHRQGRAALFAELGAQFLGMRADDPRLDAFWALAEQLDVPVGIHLGEGMQGQPAASRTDAYRAALTSPFQLEKVLLKHPRLRLYVMHAASPLTDEMIAMLFEYPTLYVDMSANNWNMPRAQFHDQLKRFVEAGFAKRILFGSDQTLFPQAIGLAIEAFEQAPFLTAEQRRDILYNNAARFLRLTKEQIAADHR